ncbi:DUF3986 family protein [Fervidibacillus halotolerans]|uniref:DUF3986 family protein n=1 Tax=Fervidibacillus halotolerans TaxID=2980027 RepID=A0A9E8RXV6_9BACI|nr:DUF3986 family protein [Fervidibacillus halotolerans]WAA13155.1 DUF3986 family protein [Fervidibacillus halotolerans]
MNFDSTVHLHIGYYEDSVDLEAIAYKLLNEDKWIVFLNDDQDVSLLEGVLHQYDYYDQLGYRIFDIQTKDLTYERGSKLFKDWLKSRNVI